jgi:(p)ppGpp synthase/HD superfamily hydrolase
MVKNPKDEQTLGPRFAQALVHAFMLHAMQKRKGPDNIPYIAHLLSVAALVLEESGDEDVAIAALLHDAIEDQGGDPTRKQIRFLFGERVAKIVDGCTDAETTPKPPWRERKEKYIQHIRHAPREVRLVSLADKLHNARSILLDYRKNGEEVWDRFNPKASNRETQLWYYRALVDAFKDAGGLVEMVDELERIVTEIEKESSKADL